MTANQGAAAALPMHMLRAPAYPDSGRNPRGSIPFTLALLRHRERTREQLGEEHASRFADRSVDTNRMLRHLTRLGHIVEDDQGLVGITPEGEKWLAAQTRNAIAPKPRKARMLPRNARAVLPLADKPLGVIAPAAGGRGPGPAATLTTAHRPCAPAPTRRSACPAALVTSCTTAAA